MKETALDTNTHAHPQVWTLKPWFPILKSATTHLARHREKFPPHVRSTDQMWHLGTNKTLPENKPGRGSTLRIIAFGVRIPALLLPARATLVCKLLASLYRLSFLICEMADHGFFRDNIQLSLRSACHIIRPWHMTTTIIKGTIKAGWTLENWPLLVGHSQIFPIVSFFLLRAESLSRVLHRENRDEVTLPVAWCLGEKF